MKWLLTTLFFLVAFTVANTAFAASNTATCKFETGDIGTVIGQGASKNEAMGDAIEKCYIKRETLFEKQRAQVVDSDRGQDLIDSCSTLSCT